MKEIILSAPGKNALNSELMSNIIRGLEEANGEPVLLTGAGDAFSAGLNLKEVLALEPATAGVFLQLLDRMTRALFEYPGPTVALVNGHAIAGGCVLTLCCDYRVMKADAGARIGLNEVALGLHFPLGVLEVVKARVPMRHWERVILGAELFDAKTARELGLVDEVSDDAVKLAFDRLSALGKHPRGAYARAKALLRRGVLQSTPEERAEFERQDLPAWTSDEVRSKISALLAR